jgi:hypothetical protein
MFYISFYFLKRSEPLAAENIPPEFGIFVIFNFTLENTVRKGAVKKQN